MMRTPAVVLAAALLLGRGRRPASAGSWARSARSAAPSRRPTRCATSQVTDAEEQQLGASVSEKIRTRYGVVQDAGRASLRGAGGRRTGGRQHAPRPVVELHRSRHRWCECLRGAGRLRSHHARRAGLDPGRSRAGGRARSRDHPRHREAHHQVDPEEQGRADGRHPRRCPAARSCSSGRSPPPTTTSSRRALGARKRTTRTRRDWRSRTELATRPAGSADS